MSRCVNPVMLSRGEASGRSHSNTCHSHDEILRARSQYDILLTAGISG